MKTIVKEIDFEKKVTNFYKEYHILPTDSAKNENVRNSEGNYIKVWDRISNDLKVKANQSKFIL